jgi:hypothetical protein
VLLEDIRLQAAAHANSTAPVTVFAAIRGHELLDHHPIEMAFAKLKAHLRARASVEHPAL